MFKKHDNIIRKQFLKSKKTLKVTLSSTIRIRLIIHIKDPKEAFGVDYIYIEEDTEIEETIIADIITTSYFIRSDAISIINWNAG